METVRVMMIGLFTVVADPFRDHDGRYSETERGEEYYQRAGVDYRLCEEACVVAVSAARHEAEIHGCWSALGPAQLWASDCRGV